MSSSKKAHRNKRKDLRNTTSQNRPMPQEQGTLGEHEVLLFNYGVPNSEELIAGGAAAGFEPGGLDRQGPLYQATPYANRTMPGQDDFAYPANVFPTTSQPTFSAAPSAYPGLAPGANPVDTATAAAISWSPATGPLYGSDDSPAVSTGSGASVFGFASQQNTPNPYAGGYVSPTALQNAPQSGFEVYSTWPQPGDGTVTLGSPNPGTLPSPALQNFEMLAVSPEGAFSDSDPTMYGEVEGWQVQPPQQQQRQQHQQPNQGMHVEAETPRHKRAKKSVDEQTAPALSTPAGTASKAPNPSGSGTGSGSSKAKLRSASRASKNAQHRPEETPQERKSRNSHNLVEKQYRNRLNMQFEILMNTLPESMRSAPPAAGAAASTSGGDSDGQGGGGGGGASAALHGAFDVGERRLSKAQVLDMSARYIRSLESERDKLEEEREELRENIRILREQCREEGG